MGDGKEETAKQRWSNWRASEEKQWKQIRGPENPSRGKDSKILESSEKRIFGKAILRLWMCKSLSQTGFLHVTKFDE